MKSACRRRENGTRFPIHMKITVTSTIASALWFAAAMLSLAGTAARAGAPPAEPPGSPAERFDYALEDAFPGISFDQPLGIVSAPGDKARVFVVEKTGRIQAVTGLDAGKPEKKLFLDLTKPRDGKLETEGECGVLGLAFPADYTATKRCFVYYSLKSGGKLHQRLSRFTISGDQADASTEQPLLSQEDPASNHNGGDLLFGNDGFLYVCVGDGGAADDQFNNARFINKGFFAAILRLDVDKKAGSLEPNAHPGVPRDEKGHAFYSVPADNPFVGAKIYHGESVDPGTVRTELWATGLRNPWRIHLDHPTGRMFVGDIGQNLYEEVDLIVKGGDYGWSHREGKHPFQQGPGRAQLPPGFKPLEPIFEYPRSIGVSVTGGVVYRGEAFPKLSGAYVFADYGTGLVMALREKGKTWNAENLTREPGIAGIGADPRNGDVLFANLAQGKVRRLKHP
jgi:glucose/arabinose dehydrogenase